MAEYTHIEYQSGFMMRDDLGLDRFYLERLMMLMTDSGSVKLKELLTRPLTDKEREQSRAIAFSGVRGA